LPKNRQGGVVITGVVHKGSAWGSLKRGDVLLKIGKQTVASDGTVSFRKGERIDLSHIVAQRHVGETMQVEFWRGGKSRRCGIVLKAPQYLVPEDRFDVKPTYFLYAGLLFVPLTRDYLKTWGSEWRTSAPAGLLAMYEDGIRTPSRREVVLLQKVLGDRGNQGYNDLTNQIVVRVQGKKIRDLRQLVRLADTAKGEFVRFDLGDGSEVVIDRELAMSRRQTILTRFGVPADRSKDLATPQ
jgi:hypothetical protein